MRKLIIFLIVLFLFSLMIYLIIDHKINSDSLLEAEVALVNKSTGLAVYDMSNKTFLYESNASKAMLPASIIKLVTCFIAIENLPLDRYVIVDETILSAVGSRIYLELGDIVYVKTLLYGLILESGNDAGIALADSLSSEKDFVEKMNQLAQKLGLKNTDIRNVTGLDETSKNFISAHDMALLASHCFTNPLYREIVKTKSYKENALIPSNKLFNFHHKHKLVVSDPFCIGGKTGYTKSAGRTLVSYYDCPKDSRQIVIVSLNLGNDWEVHKALARKYGAS